jgi:hypothetical protein
MNYIYGFLFTITWVVCWIITLSAYSRERATHPSLLPYKAIVLLSVLWPIYWVINSVLVTAQELYFKQWGGSWDQLDKDLRTPKRTNAYHVVITMQFDAKDAAGMAIIYRITYSGNFTDYPSVGEVYAAAVGACIAEAKKRDFDVAGALSSVLCFSVNPNP